MSIKEEVISYRLSNDPANKRVIACEHPRFITNKYTNERLYVACGHCRYCRDKKGLVHRSRLDAEVKQHPIGCVFWTGTYDNEHLPVIRKYDCGKYWRLEGWKDKITMFVHKDNDLFFPIPTDIKGRRCFDDESICMAYASHTDIDKFLKRLRDYIFRYMMPKDVREFYRSDRKKWTFEQYKKFDNYKKLYNEKYQIRFFITSEYGPRTWRPHFHGLFFTEDKKVLSHLPFFISETWKYGDKVRARTKVCRNGCNTGYLTTYLNSSVDYPKVLGFRPFKVFQKYSRRPLLGTFKESAEAISAFIRCGVSESDKHTVTKDGTVLPERVLLSMSDSCGYFSKPYNYRNATLDDIKTLLHSDLQSLRKGYIDAVRYKEDYLKYYLTHKAPVGTFIKRSDIFDNFLDNDYTRYSDYRFVRSAYKALSDFPELLTFDNYAHVAKDFFSTLELHKLANWYTEQELVSYRLFYRPALELIRFYPLLKDWLLHHKICSFLEFPCELFASFNLSGIDDVSFDMDSSANSIYHYFYTDNHLDMAALAVFDEIDSEYYEKMYMDIHSKMYARKFHKDKDLVENV